jgi:predicted PurR-regulated permease PerM
MSRLFLDSRTARATWTILVILGVIELACVVRAVLLLIALSLFFAYLLFPVVRLTQRWVMQRRSLAIAIAWRL